MTNKENSSEAKETSETKMPKVNDLQEIELPQFDPTPFIGADALVDEIEIKSKMFTKGTEEKISYYVQFRALVDPQGFNGEPLWATRNIGLSMDDKNKIGWGTTSKMAEFLKKYKVHHPQDMKGKSVKVQTQGDTTYLTF